MFTDQLDDIARKFRPQLRAADKPSRRIRSAALIYLKRFLKQRHLFLSQNTPDSIHQMRIELRRMRTVFAVLDHVRSNSLMSDYHKKISSFATGLGQARDYDVLLVMEKKIPTTSFYTLQMRQNLIQNISQTRLHYYTNAEASLSSVEFIDFFEKLLSFFHDQNNEDQIIASRIKHFDSSTLRHLHKKVIKQGKDFAILDLEKRHKFRVALKCLRYGQEFLVLDKGDKRHLRIFTKAMDRLLDRLGASNDAYTVSRITRELIANQEIEIVASSGFVSGWVNRGTLEDEKRLINSWNAFKDLRPY